MTDGLTLWLLPERQRWLAGGYDLEIGHFFRSGQYGGYLVDGGFFCAMLLISEQPGRKPAYKLCFAFGGIM